LDRLHEELKLRDKFLEQHQDEFSKTSLESKEKTNIKKFKSFISDLFEGTLKSRVQCANCHHESIKEDPFFDLSIPITRRPKQFKNSVETFPEQRNNSSGIIGIVTHSITTLLG
jgi:ubiquitin C-terminal hydrolase